MKCNHFGGKKRNDIFDKSNMVESFRFHPTLILLYLKECQFYTKSLISISVINILDSFLHSVYNPGARCSSVVRVFAHGAMGRRIDPSWGGPIELFLVPASAPRLV